MKFVDEAVINVQAGHGGSGARHFHREKFVAFGGPDGGNGGKGGSIILVADSNKGTLLDFQFQPRWEAEDGVRGDGGRKDGKCGKDLRIAVPVGTEVWRLSSTSSDAGTDQRPSTDISPSSTGELVCDLRYPGQEFVLCSGGRGGKGNAFFKSPTNQAPEHFQPGEPGEGGQFLLSLKLVADVGLVGLPNAGKSTLISVISSARPKIADYPFTTLSPNLGVVGGKGRASFVVADIPGLIPGAHSGKGLGIKFLKHIERTRVIAHLIDPLHIDESGERLALGQSFDIVAQELELFSPELASKPKIVVVTKADVLDRELREQVESEISVLKNRKIEVLSISSVTGTGIPELLKALNNLLLKDKGEIADNTSRGGSSARMA